MCLRAIPLLILLLAVIALFLVVEAKRHNKNKQVKSMILRQKETNPIDFIRLVAMRLIYGVATRIGLGEQISEALNGVFVPPGVDDDYDYGGGDGGGLGDLFDREDDDYDY